MTQEALGKQTPLSHDSPAPPPIFDLFFEDDLIPGLKNSFQFPCYVWKFSSSCLECCPRRGF